MNTLAPHSLRASVALVAVLSFFGSNLHASFTPRAKITAQACGALACVWATGATYRTCIKYCAENRFGQYRAILAQEDNDATCWKEIKQLLKADHSAAYNAWFSFTFLRDKRYKNYPYVLFKQHLDWYIRQLNITKIFFVGTNSHAELNNLINDLKKIRQLLITSDTYIKEQRHFEERLEDKATLATN